VLTVFADELRDIQEILSELFENKEWKIVEGQVKTAKLRAGTTALREIENLSLLQLVSGCP